MWLTNYTNHFKLTHSTAIQVVIHKLYSQTSEGIEPRTLRLYLRALPFDKLRGIEAQFLDPFFKSPTH